MSITSQALKIGAILLLTAGVSQLLPNPAQAQYSDYYSNKRQGEAIKNRTLRYGGSYGQAASDSLNYRYGYGTGQNNGYYSPYLPNQSVTTSQGGNCQRLLQQIQVTPNQMAKNIATDVYRQQCSR
jgi:hypothetical protein